MFSPTAVATERTLRSLFRSNAFSSVQDSSGVSSLINYLPWPTPKFWKP